MVIRVKGWNREFQTKGSTFALRSLTVKFRESTKKTYRQRLRVLPTCMRVTNSGHFRASFCFLSKIIVNYRQITGGMIVQLPNERVTANIMLWETVVCELLCNVETSKYYSDHLARHNIIPIGTGIPSYSPYTYLSAICYQFNRGFNVPFSSSTINHSKSYSG